MGISGIISAVSNAFAVLNAVLIANPIGLVVAGIAALIAIIVLLWVKNQAFRDFIIGVFTAIKNGAAALANALVKLFTVDIPNAFKSFMNKLNELKNNIINKFTSIKDDFIKIGSNIAKGIIDGLTQKIGDIIGKVTDIKDKIVEQFKDFNPLGAIGDAVKNGVSNITANMQVKSDAAPVQSGRPTNTMSAPSTNVYINTSASKLFNAVVEQNNGYAKGGYTPLASY